MFKLTRKAAHSVSRMSFYATALKHISWHVFTNFSTQVPTTLKDGVILPECQLEQTAKLIVEKYMLIDDEPNFQCSFLYTAFLYTHLRRAIRFEEGEQIIRHWRLWLSYFLGSGKHNYASEAATLLCNIQAIFPRYITYIVTNNRTVNMDGRIGHGKPIDQMFEHYDL